MGLGLNILLVGEQAAGIKMLRAIDPGKHNIVAVMSSPRNSSSTGPTLWTVANHLGFTTWPAEWVKDSAFADKVHSKGIDIILNAHSLYLYHPKVLDVPHIGCFNLHPGPLPRYAGLNSVSWAIYKGEKDHGVTIHKMVANVDAGPIVYQTLFEMGKSDTALMVSTKCVEIGIQMMLQLLETASKSPDDIPYIAQDLSRREYFGNKVPQNGYIYWALSALDVFNFVRACDYYPFSSPWGYPKAVFEGLEFNIVKTDITGDAIDTSPGTIRVDGNGIIQVACGDEWLRLHKLLFAGQYLKASEILIPGGRLTEVKG